MSAEILVKHDIAALTPPVGYSTVYIKADGLFYSKNSAGVEVLFSNSALTETLTNKTIDLTNNTLIATSLQLKAALTDETGSGAAVFANSPALLTPTGIVKNDVGLGSVDNTSDINKPVSTAQQTALDLKAPINNAALTGIPTAPTAAPATNTDQIATTAFTRAEIASLVASAPAALDTLNELAVALGNDANFATTVTDALATKEALANKSISVVTDLASDTKYPSVKAVYDWAISLFVNLAGIQTITGAKTLSNTANVLIGSLGIGDPKAASVTTLRTKAAGTTYAAGNLILENSAGTAAAAITLANLILYVSEDGVTDRLIISSTGLAVTGSISATTTLNVTGASELGSALNGGSAYTTLQGYSPNAINGSYGQILFSANINYSTGARRFLVTNALNVNTYAIIRSVDASTTPTLNASGVVTSGTTDFSISNAGIISLPGGGGLVVTGSISATTTLSVTGSSNLTGIVGIGGANSAPNSYALQINKSNLAATNTYGISVDFIAPATSTVSVNGFLSNPSLVAAAFTTTSLRHFYAADTIKGAGSAITTQYGLFIANMTAGVTNYAIKTNGGLVDFGNGAVSTTGTLSSGALAVTGAISATTANYPVTKAERTSVATGTMYSISTSQHTTSGDMVDGFGAQHAFQIRDNAGVDNYIGGIGARRAGADNSGEITIHTVSAGVDTVRGLFTSTGLAVTGAISATTTLNVTGTSTLAAVTATTVRATDLLTAHYNIGAAYPSNPAGNFGLAVARNHLGGLNEIDFWNMASGSATTSASYIWYHLTGVSSEVEMMRLTRSTGLDVTGSISSTTTTRTGGYTVATLPAGVSGDEARVTDATAPTWNGALTGGGTVIVKVLKNATIWVAQ